MIVDPTYQSVIIGSPRITWSEAEELYIYEVDMVRNAINKLRQIEANAK